MKHIHTRDVSSKFQKENANFETIVLDTDGLVDILKAMERQQQQQQQKKRTTVPSSSSASLSSSYFNLTPMESYDRTANWMVCEKCGFYKRKRVLKVNGKSIDKSKGDHNMALMVYEEGLHPFPPCSTEKDNLCGAPLYLPPPTTQAHAKILKKRHLSNL